MSLLSSLFFRAGDFSGRVVNCLPAKYLSMIVVLLLAAKPTFSQDIASPGVKTHDHDYWKTEPRELFFSFEAFVLSFDDADDDDGDGSADRRGIPNWVSFHIHRTTHEFPVDRPTWTTDRDLFSRRIAPGDETYTIPKKGTLQVLRPDLRFVRGHMCPKDTAERVSARAAEETHTLLNAVPQLQVQNNGIWKALELQCGDWADTHGEVWVTCGPVFSGKSPSLWLGQNEEVRAAVPDALFKIVCWGDKQNPEVSAYMIPNILPGEEKDFSKYAVTVDRIEADTGLDFLTVLDDDVEKVVESRKKVSADTAPKAASRAKRAKSAKKTPTKSSTTR